MIGQGFNFVDSTVKAITDFFEMRVENLEPEQDKVNLLQLPRKQTNTTFLR